jgi:hypothetical protein
MNFGQESETFLFDLLNNDERFPSCSQTETSHESGFTGPSSGIGFETGPALDDGNPFASNTDDDSSLSMAVHELVFPSDSDDTFKEVPTTHEDTTHSDDSALKAIFKVERMDYSKCRFSTERVKQS